MSGALANSSIGSKQDVQEKVVTTPRKASKVKTPESPAKVVKTPKKKTAIKKATKIEGDTDA